MPPEVQKSLENVIGLMKIYWDTFAEHIVPHVDEHRKEKRAHKEQTNQLAIELTHLQLTELTNRQRKTKAPVQVQAPVMTAAPPQLEGPVHKQQTEAQVPPLPPIHVNANQPGGNYRPQHKCGRLRARGGRDMRVGWRGRPQSAHYTQPPFSKPSFCQQQTRSKITIQKTTPLLQPRQWQG